MILTKQKTDLKAKTPIETKSIESVNAAVGDYQNETKTNKNKYMLLIRKKTKAVTQRWKTYQIKRYIKAKIHQKKISKKIKTEITLFTDD